MKTIRSNILEMSPYSPGKPISEVQRELGLEHVVKLASNENPLGPSPKAVEAVRRAAADMHVYPDSAAYELKAGLSHTHSIPPESLLIGNGSDELIHLLGLIFLEGPADEVIVGDPSFVRYDASAHLADSTLIKVGLDARFTHDLTAMARATTDRTKLIFIANPNNPTGTIIRRADFDQFLNDIPDQAVVVLDEAYFEFAAHVNGFPNSADYVRDGKNVIGLRTFSKAYGLAGIRLGYGFASPEICDAVERAREPFNVNALAQVAALAALQDHDHVRRTLENNSEGVKVISEALLKAGFRPHESFANFVFAELSQPAEPLFQALLRRGVIVRSGGAFGCPTCVRVSVGTGEEVKAFTDALVAVVQVGSSL